MGDKRMCEHGACSSIANKSKDEMFGCSRDVDCRICGRRHQESLECGPPYPLQEIQIVIEDAENFFRDVYLKYDERKWLNNHFAKLRKEVGIPVEKIYRNPFFNFKKKKFSFSEIVKNLESRGLSMENVEIEDICPEQYRYNPSTQSLQKISSVLTDLKRIILRCASMTERQDKMAKEILKNLKKVLRLT